MDTCSVLSIILADDDADDRAIFQDVLKEASPNTKLSIVPDGFALMALLSSYIPDLLFLDLEMPLKNGLQCLKEIKENPALIHLPVIVLSATNRPHNVATAYEMGAHLVLQKTNTYKEISEAIRLVINLDWSDPEIIRKNHFTNGAYQPFSA